MRLFDSIQARLAFAIGLSVTVLWLAAAAVTARRVGQEMEQVFNDGLKTTAERILPIARRDLREGRLRREPSIAGNEGDSPTLIGRAARYGQDLTFVVRDREGRILLASDGVDASVFPPFTQPGFRCTKTHKIYADATRDGNLTIDVAEPLSHRRGMSHTMLAGLALPLIIVTPLSLLAIAVAVRRSLRPVRGLQQGLARRGARDLSPLPDANLPSELAPISAGVNQLLGRLTDAFEAERSFAANAAHELRTPVAGAIAQAQRIRFETREERTGQRATEIETTLKRLMRMSEKLMQLARAEGGRLQLDDPSDLRTVLRLIVDDFVRAGERRITLVLTEVSVLSMLDPDIVGILGRNLIENALRHGAQDGAVDISLRPDGLLCISNEGAAVPADALDRLMRRFERGAGKIDGNGLGLAIVKTIADRSGATLSVTSPLPESSTGVRVTVKLPTVG
ncbi:two-component sensor histidine kinase [Bosea sp. SSUT16]|uniref:histidine kinase n=1 Tax=Bosea spartocytisi TaxID=2773451 RepID=A0A927ECW5_9HYPH|nr:ATP-binding protein [Bosea spartocytisi]MBD3848588.1 two-component sensor histidine kinase [Bosea spartocytisi]MCT4475036.1 ATP-binding protein [Bosea spartocytisi]